MFGFFVVRFARNARITLTPLLFARRGEARPIVQRRYWLLIAIALVSGWISRPAAGTIALAWDAVDHPELAGYRLYYDTVTGQLGISVDVGLETAVTLSDLVDCTAHEIAVKAYDGTGAESLSFSNMVAGWPRPTLISMSPPEVERNSEIDVTLVGTNFQSGATVIFSDPGISVGSVTIQGCLELSVAITVSDQAPLGPLTVRVANPDQVFGEATSLLSVIADSTAPTISSVEAGAVGATSATVSWLTNEAADSQVSFRRQGESAYQSTAVDPLATTSHAVVLSGLHPDTVYEFHVRSADQEGNSADSGADLSFTTEASAFIYIRAEAEAGVLVAPATPESGSAVFNGGWVEVPAGASGTPASPAGESRLGFFLPHAGDWRVWVRARGTDAGGASWFEGVDDVDLAPLAFSAPNLWAWRAGRTHALAAGLHTLRLGGQEGEARADRVIITDDPGFTPTEEPGADVTPPQPVSGFTAAPASGAVHLSWTNPAEVGALELVVRYRTDGQFPQSPADGNPLVLGAVTPGAASSFDHLGLVNGTTYSYAAFAIDFSGNVSTAATATAKPGGVPPGPVMNLRRTDTQ